MKHLAIGPGAMTYFAFLGALGALRDCHELDNLEDISDLIFVFRRESDLLMFSLKWA